MKAYFVSIIKKTKHSDLIIETKIFQFGNPTVKSIALVFTINIASSAESTNVHLIYLLSLFS